MHPKVTEWRTGVIVGNVFAGMTYTYTATKATGMKVAHNYGLATHNT